MNLKDTKNDHAKEWSKVLGGMDFDVIEESEEVNETSQYEQEPV